MRPVETLYPGGCNKGIKVRFDARIPFQVFSPLDDTKGFIRTISALRHASHEVHEYALVDTRENVRRLELNKGHCREPLRQSAKLLNFTRQPKKHAYRIAIGHPCTYDVEARLAMREGNPAVKAVKKLSRQLSGESRKKNVRTKISLRQQITIVAN